MSEKDYYKPIKETLEKLFRSKIKGDIVYLEITAYGNFSNELKRSIPNNLNIIFTFLKGKEFAPDITGFVKKEYYSEFIVVEVKDEPIKIDHIYQIRKYSDLFQSKFSFLISTYEIPEEIKRLCKENYQILSTPSIYNSFTLIWFNKDIQEFCDLYPENPFKKELYWK